MENAWAGDVVAGKSIACKAAYGRVEVSSWFVWRDGVMVGMGRAIGYDKGGNVISDKTEPTGVVMRWS